MSPFHLLLLLFPLVFAEPQNWGFGRIQQPFGYQHAKVLTRAPAAVYGLPGGYPRPPVAASPPGASKRPVQAVAARPQTSGSSIPAGAPAASSSASAGGYYSGYYRPGVSILQAGAGASNAASGAYAPPGYYGPAATTNARPQYSPAAPTGYYPRPLQPVQAAHSPGYYIPAPPANARPNAAPSVNSVAHNGYYFWPILLPNNAQASGIPSVPTQGVTPTLGSGGHVNSPGAPCWLSGVFGGTGGASGVASGAGIQSGSGSAAFAGSGIPPGPSPNIIPPVGPAVATGAGNPWWLMSGIFSGNGVPPGAGVITGFPTIMPSGSVQPTPDATVPVAGAGPNTAVTDTLPSPNASPGFVPDPSVLAGVHGGPATVLGNFAGSSFVAAAMTVPAPEQGVAFAPGAPSGEVDPSTSSSDTPSVEGSSQTPDGSLVTEGSLEAALSPGGNAASEAGGTLDANLLETSSTSSPESADISGSSGVSEGTSAAEETSTSDPSLASEPSSTAAGDTAILEMSLDNSANSSVGGDSESSTDMSSTSESLPSEPSSESPSDAVNSVEVSATAEASSDVSS